MAKRKKAQSKKQQDAAADPESNEDAFLNMCSQEIKEQESRGVRSVSRSERERAENSGDQNNVNEDRQRQSIDTREQTTNDNINTSAGARPADSPHRSVDRDAKHIHTGDSGNATPDDENDESSNELSKSCTSDDMRILRESGAFGDVELQLSEECKRSFPSSLNAAGAGRPYRAPPPPVPIYGDKPSTASSEALGQELRYSATVMQPAEMRWLVSESAGDMLEKSPVTHTDISDAVIASIAPSTAQKVAFMADAQYKYTTAQFSQVYLKMRHVVLEHKIMLASARADAMSSASSDLDIPDLQPGDMDVPVSAVNASRDLIDKEKSDLI